MTDECSRTAALAPELRAAARGPARSAPSGVAALGVRDAPLPVPPAAPVGGIAPAIPPPVVAPVVALLVPASGARLRLVKLAPSPALRATVCRLDANDAARPVASLEFAGGSRNVGRGLERRLEPAGDGALLALRVTGGSPGGYALLLEPCGPAPREP